MIMFDGASLAQQGPAIDPTSDWLVTSIKRPVEIEVSSDGKDLTMTNGLISRTWRLTPNAACISYKNLISDGQFIRSICPEAIMTIDGNKYEIGGLHGQPEHGYINMAWLDNMHVGQSTFVYTGYEVGEPIAPYEWNPLFQAPEVSWPPKGKRLTLKFEAPKQAILLESLGNSKEIAEKRSVVLEDISKLKVEVNYEMYVGAPLMAKWVNVENAGDKKVIIEKMTAEQLAVPRSQRRRLHVEADYTCFRLHTPRWELDNRFATTTDSSPTYHEYILGESVYYYPTRWMDNLWAVPAEDMLGIREGGMRTLMSSRYPHGPGKHLRSGETFQTFRTFTLLHDNDDRMRQSLGRRRMYRILCPQAQENPIFFHILRSDSATIRKAVDQCAELGFDMAILTFGSGFNMRTSDPALIARYKADFDYAHSKGIKIGGYVLFASSASHGVHDAVDPETGQLGGGHGRSLCLATAYSDEYFAKLYKFIDETGMDVIEADGPYHGYPCGATNHKYHDGTDDSYYAQWQRQVKFFRGCMKRGMYIHAPDWYYYCGSHRSSLGYRESSVFLPHWIKVMVARRNVFDGTVLKTPSMGWMWDPIAPGHGAHTDMNPLSRHLDLYNLHLAQSFGSGVMYVWRNTVLYDDEASKALVKKWVEFYRDHWEILQSDILHLRRPDGRDIDYFMHVNSRAGEKGLLMVFNPLQETVERTITLPLYYTGLTGAARISEQGRKGRMFRIDRFNNVQLPLHMSPRSVTWFLIK